MSAVGVVIASRDRRATLLATLRQLEALSEAPDIAVVDNGSVDGTADAVRAAHPGVTMVALPRDIGAGARTAGVQALDAPLIAFSDDDSWWAPGALGRAADTFEAKPRLGLLAARILVGPKRRLDPTCAAMRDSPLPRAPDLPGPSVLGFVACGTVVRRSAFLSVGGFPAGVAFGGEETLLALDLAAAGWGLAYVASVVAHHHPACSDQRPPRDRAEIRNALRTAWLRRRMPAAARLTAHLTASAVRTRQTGVLLEAAAGAPRVLRRRRPLPRALERQARSLEG